MNTFKTLSLYNRHAVDCKQVKSENQTQSNNGQQRSYSSQGAVVKRSFSDSGGGQQGTELLIWSLSKLLKCQSTIFEPYLG